MNIKSYIKDLTLASTVVTDIVETDYTAFEVFPTDKVIPAGTVDSIDGLSALFNWNDEDIQDMSNCVFTDLQYSVDVPQSDTLYIYFYTNHDKVESNVLIDFGDGIKLNVHDVQISDDGLCFYNNRSDFVVKHKYSGQNVNKKKIVKIYGNTYYYYGIVGGLNGGSIIRDSHSLVSRIFDYNLPIASCVISLASSFRDALRLLKINVPSYYSFNNVNNVYQMLINCSNLIIANIPNSCTFYNKTFYAAARMFYNCENLQSSNVKMPMCVFSSGRDQYQQFYYNCKSLQSNLIDLLPFNGFSTRIVNLNSVFSKCTNLKCNYSAVSNILWNDSSKVWIETNNVFSGCTTDGRDELPASWGGPDTIVKLIITDNAHIQISVQSYQNSNCTIYWGDGSHDIANNVFNQYVHDYEQPGEYYVKLDSTCYRFQFSNQLQVVEVVKIGDNVIKLDGAFKDCTNLIKTCDWGENNDSCSDTYLNCRNLTGSIPKWKNAITNAYRTYYDCQNLTGPIPPWNNKITNAYHTFYNCKLLTGSVPEWGSSITNAKATYWKCTGLTGVIPLWGSNITDASYTFNSCSGLTGTASDNDDELMPSHITTHNNAVSGCNNSITSKFLTTWGGTRTE